jgi:hypothetical protein
VCCAPAARLRLRYDLVAFMTSSLDGGSDV